VSRRLAYACALAGAAWAVPLPAAADCGMALKAKQRWIAEADGMQVAFVTQPSPVPVGRHFALRFAVCDARAARSVRSVAVDADMPAHRHGMNYRASVSARADGLYDARGLMFHMPGRWRVIFDLALEDRTLRVTHELEVQ
jgi:hypothetical protein